MGQGDASEWLMFGISDGCVELVLGAAERNFEAHRLVYHSASGPRSF